MLLLLSNYKFTLGKIIRKQKILAKYANVLNFTYPDVIRNLITHLTLDSHYSMTVTDEVRNDT